MSNGIKVALAKEEGKLVRQIANRDSTIAALEVLGDDARMRGNLDRQEQAIKDTEANIAKLSKAVKALK